MTEERIVIWKVKKLAKEYNMAPTKVGRLLKAIGAKVWSNSSSNKSFYWGEND